MNQAVAALQVAAAAMVVVVALQAAVVAVVLKAAVAAMEVVAVKQLHHQALLQVSKIVVLLKINVKGLQTAQKQNITENQKSNSVMHETDKNIFMSL